MERQFDQQLEKLRVQLIKMCSLIDEQVDLSIKSIEESNIELAVFVEVRDSKVDKYDNKIEKICHRIIALNQPVAMDLRLLISALKINSNLERIGDLAVNIARNSKEIITKPNFFNSLRFTEIASTAREMLRGAFDSFINRDPELARMVLLTDDKLDKLVRESSKILIEAMKESPSNVDCAVLFYSIFQELERIGDHATNICEEVFFIIEARSLKHRNLNEEDLIDDL